MREPDARGCGPGQMRQMHATAFSIAKNATADAFFAVAAIMVQCNNKLAF
jgi:hypothetical protein